MRVAEVAGRAVVLRQPDSSPEDAVVAVDVEAASGGRFGPDVQALYGRWEEFQTWVAQLGPDTEGRVIDPAAFGCPVPSPSQVFAIGLNYAEHAAESGMVGERAIVPPTFTKFPSSLAAPNAALTLPSDKVDWEIELVAVIGTRAEHVSEADAWTHIAGLAVGQDFSERAVQTAGPAPQFSLGKSFRGFGPIGPWLVTPDEFSDPTDLELVCEINGEQVQKGRTSEMVWSVAQLVATLSRICTLQPGDVLFTGTPSGVGAARSPQRFLEPGDVVASRIEGIGEIRQTCVAPTSPQES